MATINLYRGTDMVNIFFVYEADITIANTTQIQGVIGSRVQNYFGHFSYNPFGLTGGRVTSANSFDGGVKIWEMTEGSYDILTIANYEMRNDAKGLLAWVLSGPDIINGSNEDDVLNGFAGHDQIFGNGGNDTIIASSGNDYIDGGEGIDKVVYNFARSSYTLTQSANGHLVSSQQQGSDTLVNVERLQFSDVNVALDLAGNAGMVAKLLGAVFGASAIQERPNYVGIGLELADSGMSYSELGAVAIGATGKTAVSDVVSLLWNNVVGSPPSTTQLQTYVNRLNSGMAVGDLVQFAAETELNQINIDLVGLQSSGIEFF